MRYSPGIFGVAAVLTTVALGAQTPSPATKPASPAADGSTLTVTGCLRAGQSSGTFVLANVSRTATKDGPKDPASHHDTTPERDRPTTPATASARQADGIRPGDTVRLAGSPSGATLADHVGHTVTVTGMLAPADPIVKPGVVLPDAPATGDTTSRSGAGSKEASSARVLNVRGLTHVAGTCK